MQDKSDKDAWDNLYSRWKCGIPLPWREPPSLIHESSAILRSILARHRGGRLLDYGCGIGDYVPLYLENNKFEVIGADIAQEAVKHCNGIYANQNADFFETSTPEELFTILEQKGKDTTFDIIVFWATINHISPDSLSSFINAFAEHLAPDGIFIVSGWSIKAERFKNANTSWHEPTKDLSWPIEPAKPTLAINFQHLEQGYIFPQGLSTCAYFICERSLLKRMEKALLDELSNHIGKISFFQLIRYNVAHNIIETSTDRGESTVYFRDKGEAIRVLGKLLKQRMAFDANKSSFWDHVYKKKRKKIISISFYPQSDVKQRIPLRYKETLFSKRYIFGEYSQDAENQASIKNQPSVKAKKFIAMPFEEQLKLAGRESFPTHNLNFKRDVSLPPDLVEGSEEYQSCETFYYSYRQERALFCYVLLNPVHSTNGYDIGDGVLCITAFDPIEETVLKRINYIYLRWSAALSVDSYVELTRREAMKSAIAAIMSRNMSHNLGSHVVTNAKHQILELEKSQGDDLVKNQLRGLSTLLQYLQERQDFIAVIANDEHYPKGPLNFKSHVFDMLAMDGLSVRHGTEDRMNNYILDNIVRSEGVARKGSVAGIDGGIGIELQLVKHETSGGCKVFKSLERPEIGDAFANITLSVNYGLNGRQAFLTILENIIRNSAKHDRKLLGALENNMLLFSIIFKERADGYFDITICDNKKNFTDLQHKFAKLGLVVNGRLAPLHILREGEGSVDRENKGIKEIAICLAWMKHGEKTVSDEIGYDTLQNTPWELLEVVGVDNDTFDVYDWEAPDKPSQLSLGYRFRLAKFKNVHLLSASEWRKGDTSKEILERLSELPGASLYAIRRSDYNTKPNGKTLLSIPRLVVVDDDATVQSLAEKFEDLLEQNIKQRFGNTLPRLRISDELRATRKDWGGAQNLVVREYSWELDSTWEKDYPGSFIHFRHHYGTTLEDAVTKDDVMDLDFRHNAVFTEGISGGNFTNTLIRTDITRAAYYGIAEAALVEIAIVDERLFAKYAGRSTRETTEVRPIWTYLRQKGIHILNGDEHGIYDLWGHYISDAKVVPSSGYDYISVHLGLLDKTNGNDSSEKICTLFKPHCISDVTKVAIHSGRGGLAQVENIAFIPLSGIEWALENCKFVLSDFFHGLKYPPIKNLAVGVVSAERLPRVAHSERSLVSPDRGPKPSLRTDAADGSGSSPYPPRPQNAAAKMTLQSSAKKIFLFTTYSSGENTLTGKTTDAINVYGIDKFSTGKGETDTVPGFDATKIAHIDSAFFFYPCMTKLAIPPERHGEFVRHLVEHILSAIPLKNGEAIDLHLILHASDVRPVQNPSTKDKEHPLIADIRRKFPDVADATVWWFSHDGKGKGIHREIVCNGSLFDGKNDKALRLLTKLAECTNTPPPAVSEASSSRRTVSDRGRTSNRPASPILARTTNMPAPLPRLMPNNGKWVEVPLRMVLQKEHINRLTVWQLCGATDVSAAEKIFSTAIGPNESNWDKVPSPNDCTARLHHPRPMLVVGEKPLDELFMEDRRAHYLDTSIWCRYATSDSEADAIRCQFENYAKLGLYQSNVGKEHLEYWARACINSQFGKFSDSGHSQIVPNVFHSEGAMRVKSEALLARIKKDFARKPLTWKILLVDDHAETALSGGANSQTKISSKLDVIRDVLSSVFSGVIHRKDGSETKFGLSDGLLTVHLYYTGKSKPIEETAQLIHRNRFDVILLDYLFIAPDSETHGISDFDTADQLLDLLKTLPKAERGPLGKFWISNVSAFTSALRSMLLAQGLSFYEEFWNIDAGGCAINRPELFKHNLLAFMLQQLMKLTGNPFQKQSEESVRIITLLDLLQAVFLSKDGNVCHRADIHFPDLLKFEKDCDLLRQDIEWGLSASERSPEKLKANSCKSEIVYSLFPDIVYYNNTFWDHLFHLVHLIAYGTQQQWPQMLANFKEIKHILLEANKDDVRAEELVDAIEAYIIELHALNP